MGAVANQVIDRKTNVLPIGSKNGVNLSYQTPDKFDPLSLEVFLSGLFLQRDVDYEVQPDNKSFEILVNPAISERLNSPPQQFESFLLNYVTC